VIEGQIYLARDGDDQGGIKLSIISPRGGPVGINWQGMDSLRRSPRLKIQGIVLASDDPRAGVGLRVSRRKFAKKLSGNADWSGAEFDFEIQQDESDVELVCELRAEQGDAWFDLKTLKVIRR
jgi:hypothetical protein